MKSQDSLLNRLWANVDAKLGRCPFCMRSSALGTAIGWMAFLALSHYRLNALATTLAATAATGFTLLLLSHLIAYMARVAGRIRQCERSQGPDYVDLGRREFVGTVAKAGAAALCLSLFGRAPASALQVVKCKGVYSPNSDITGTGATQAAAEAAYVTDGVNKCKAFCKPRSCKATACQRAADVVVSQPTSTFDRQTMTWTSRGKLKTCACDCFACDGDHAPLAPDSNVMGMGDTQAQAEAALLKDADTKCDNYCLENPACDALAKELCKRSAAPKAKYRCQFDRAKNKWVCAGIITNCPCLCQKQ